MTRWQLVGVVLVLVVGVGACDGDPPEEAIELDDGTEVRVVTSDLSLHDEVVVDLEAGPEPQADDPSVQVVATNPSAEVLAVVDPRDRPDDGLLVAERGYDLAWDRGEIEYDIPPSVFATELAPGSTIPVGNAIPIEPGGADGADSTLRVCLEVIDGPIARSDDDAGPSGEVLIRRHDTPVELACSGAIELENIAIDAVRADEVQTMSERPAGREAVVHVRPLR